MFPIGSHLSKCKIRCAAGFSPVIRREQCPAWRNETRHERAFCRGTVHCPVPRSRWEWGGVAVLPSLRHPWGSEVGKARTAWHPRRLSAVGLCERGYRKLQLDSETTVRQVEMQLKGWKIADAMAELRIWLDHNDCVPASFDIATGPRGAISVRVEFRDDAMADAFMREFGR